jgi:hypothetical protein
MGVVLINMSMGVVVEKKGSDADANPEPIVVTEVEEKSENVDSVNTSGNKEVE